jgi:hypothetical protein
LSTAIFVYAATAPVNGYAGGSLYARMGGKKWIRQVSLEITFCSLLHFFSLPRMSEASKIRDWSRFFPASKLFSSAAASGWAGWALAHLEFESSVNPFTIRGADYAHHITASPPGFEKPAASLFSIRIIFST